MQEIQTAWEALRFGGAMVYPLMFLGIVAAVIVVDRALLYFGSTRIPDDLRDLVETYGFAWGDLETRIRSLGQRNAFARVFGVIAENRTHPAWWVESRAADEASRIEATLGRGLWLLETIVTAAPLLGLLGTITGMMQSFRVIGGSGLVAPTEVTGGVAQALIATALGLLIALVALFAFNWFSRSRSSLLDELERLSSRLVDRIRLDGEARPDVAKAADVPVTVALAQVRAK
jgi:biopolymer transport protein ExbB